MKVNPVLFALGTIMGAVLWFVPYALFGLVGAAVFIGVAGLLMCGLETVLVNYLYALMKQNKRNLSLYRLCKFCSNYGPVLVFIGGTAGILSLVMYLFGVL